jgi:predicted nuclease with RNAse H fold
MPAAMSAIEMPALLGSSGVPVIETNPDSLWISRS